MSWREGRLTSKQCGGQFAQPFAELAVASGAVSKPGVMQPVRMSPTVGVEGSEAAGAHSNFLSRLRKKKSVMCLLQHCICVSGPCEILGDVNARNLKLFTRSTGVLSMVMGVVLCSVSWNPPPAPWSCRCWVRGGSPGTISGVLTPLCRPSHRCRWSGYHRCVIGKFDDDVGAVCSCTVVCVQGVQEWAWERSPAEHQCWGSAEMKCCCPSDHLTLPVRKVQDPAAQRSVQSQSLELLNRVAGTMVLNAEL